MSMQEYPVYEQAAFLISKEVAAHIMFVCDKQTDTVPDSIQALSQTEFNQMASDGTLPDAAYFNESLAFALLGKDVDGTSTFEFVGTVSTVYPDRAQNPLDKDYKSDSIAFISAKKAPDLFSTAYASPEELLEEFKSVFAQHEIVLPDNFDWWAHIVSIQGTYFC